MSGTICSMTGFAAREKEVAAGTLIIELRAVNHRYLELHLRMDDALRSLEPAVRETISERLGRGKVECRMSLMAPTGAASKVNLDEHALQKLADLNTRVRDYFPESQTLNVADILRWPGVLSTESVSADDLRTDVLNSLTQALQDLKDARQREGEKLKNIILERVSSMEKQIAIVRPLLPALMQAHQEKLVSRMREVMQTAEDDRIRQELTLFAQKIDVDEELERLDTHLQEVKRILGKGGAVGKRLDFLMQELNREANTLGSKSVSTETSQVSMELKVLIEQMREQIQNLE